MLEFYGIVLKGDLQRQNKYHVDQNIASQYLISRLSSIVTHPYLKVLNDYYGTVNSGGE